MIEAKDLALTVERQVAGELITNARKIQEFVQLRVKDYIPENYYDNLDAAKKDRAELNNAAKNLDSKRLELEREFNKPFEEFKTIIKETVTTIQLASGKLDEVVKAVEETEKAEKKAEIKEYFDTLNFVLLPLDFIFDEKWLNKGAKIKTVKEELSEKIASIYRDIKVLESYGEDSETLKAYYLKTLDLGDAITEAVRMKDARERLAKEKEARAEREHSEKINEQKEELKEDYAHALTDDKAATIAAEAFEEEKDPVMSVTLSFTGTRLQLLNLRKYMTDNGIEYEKVEL